MTNKLQTILLALFLTGFLILSISPRWAYAGPNDSINYGAAEAPPAVPAPPAPVPAGPASGPTKPQPPTIKDLDTYEQKLPPNLPKFGTVFSDANRDPVKATESFLLRFVISPIFLLAAGVAVIMILYASFRIISARGEEEGITKAKTTLIWAAAGLALIMLSYTLVRNIGSIIGELEKPEPTAAPAAPVPAVPAAPPQ